MAQVTHNLTDINMEVSRVVEQRKRAISDASQAPPSPVMLASVGIALPASLNSPMATHGAPPTDTPPG
jgi:hypothetical protein